MTCPTATQLQACYDGELQSAERAAIESHSQQCPACAAQLADLRQLSAEIHRADLPLLPDSAIHRLRELPVRRQRSLLRFAEWMSAAAAAVLVVGLINLQRNPAPPPAPAANYERAMLTLQMDPATSGTDSAQLIDWIAGHGGVDEP